MKKTIIILLLIGAFIMPTFAMEKGQGESDSDTGITLMFAYIYDFQASFDISSSGKAQMNAFLDGVSGDSSSIEARLQRYENGNWVTIQTFSASSNTPTCQMSRSYYVMSEYSYRTVYYAYVYSGPIMLDHTTMTSSAIYY